MSFLFCSLLRFLWLILLPAICMCDNRCSNIIHDSTLTIVKGSLTFTNSDLNLNGLKQISGLRCFDRPGVLRVEYRSALGDGWSPLLTQDGLNQTFKVHSNKNVSVLQSIGWRPIAVQLRLVPLQFASDKHRSSVRVQISGCDFDQRTYRLHGDGYLSVPLPAFDLLQSYQSNISILMRTASAADGVLLSAVSSQSDFLLLQIKNGRLELMMELGSGFPTVLIGFVPITDGGWHRIVVVHDSRSIQLFADGVLLNSSTSYGSHRRLDLDSALLIGGPVLKDPILYYAVPSNFTGCVADFRLNGLELLSQSSTEFVGDITFCSPEDRTSDDTITLATETSMVLVNAVPDKNDERRLDVSFEFRTFSESAALFEVELGKIGSSLKLLIKDGRIRVELEGIGASSTLFDNIIHGELVSDLLWHRVEISSDAEEVALRVVVDAAGSHWIRGGEIAPLLSSYGRMRYGGDGYVGCFRHRRMSALRVEETTSGNVSRHACHLVDRCHPNACRNGAQCHQRSLTDFECDCNSGFRGRLCLTVELPRSCEEHFDNGGSIGNTTLLLNGGSFDQRTSINVECNLEQDRVVTRLSAANPTVSSSAAPQAGQLVHELDYALSLTDLEQFVTAYATCRQHVAYRCRGGARLMAGDSSASPTSWWAGRTAGFVDSWGDTPANSRACDCAISRTCVDRTKSCNCDSGRDTEDVGDVTDMDRLPVTRLYIGGTGGGKSASVSVGPLVCQQPVSAKPITLSSRDAYISVGRVESNAIVNSPSSIAVELDFKSTHDDGVLISNEYSEEEFSDAVTISLRDAHTVAAELISSGSVLEITLRSILPLNDDSWHRVYLEVNAFEVTLLLEHQWKDGTHLPINIGQVPQLRGVWRLGAPASTPNTKAGLAGMFRNVRLSAESVRLSAIFEEGRPHSYSRSGAHDGVWDACVDARQRHGGNVCLNGGRCRNRYDRFVCDCRTSAFDGDYCLQDVGYTIRSGGVLISYTMHTDESEPAGNFHVGFETSLNDTQILFGKALYGDATLNVSTTEEGHLLVAVSVGTQFYNIVDPRSVYSDGSHHYVMISVEDAVLSLNVNYYEPLKRRIDHPDFPIKLDHWVLVNEDFIGCVSRLRLGNAFPLKENIIGNRLQIQRSRSDASFERSACPSSAVAMANERILAGPLPVRDQPRVGLVNGIVVEAVPKRRHTSSSVVAPALAAALLVLVLVAALAAWRFSRQHPAGEYKTHEGEQLYRTPDSSETALIPTAGGAAATSSSPPACEELRQLRRPREFFI